MSFFCTAYTIEVSLVHSFVLCLERNVCRFGTTWGWVDENFWL